MSLAGNEIFKQPLFESAKYGVINLHSALLPKYRTLTKEYLCRRFGSCDTTKKRLAFLSFLWMKDTLAIDSGPIVVQKEVPLLDRTQAELIWELKFRGADAIVEACNLIAEHGANTPTMKNDEK